MSVPLNLFEDWLNNKGLKERSISNYIYYFNKFTYPKFNQETVSKFLSEKAHRNTVSRGFLVNYKDFLMINSQELGIDSYYYKEISDVQFPKITGRKSERLPSTLSEDQIFLLEKHLSTEELKLMLLITYFAGLRLQEMIRIRINSFNWEIWKNNTGSMGEIKVFGKGNKEGIAIIPGSLMVRISRFIRSSVNVKGSAGTLFHLKSRSFQMYLAKAGIDSGITRLDPEGKPTKDTAVHPHKLRHSHGHNLITKGVDIRYVQESLRHSSIQTTQIYTKLSKEDLKDKLSTVMK